MTVNVDPEALAARDAAELPANSYMARHIDAVREVVHERVDVRGYFALSLPTQRRTPKSSARWYSNPIAAHRTRGAA